MRFLYKQKEVLKLLHKNGLATFTKASFSEAVKRGQIPYHHEDGIKVKLYDYDEVVEAIQKAGIGGVSKTKQTKVEKRNKLVDKLDEMPEPKEGQSQQEYGEMIVNELGEKPTVTDANIYKTIYQGKIEKLKYEKLKGESISRDEVENTAYTVARTIRNKLNTIPERLANELASIDDAHVIKEMLYKEIEIVLDGFSEDSFNV